MYLQCILHGKLSLAETKFSPTKEPRDEKARSSVVKLLQSQPLNTNPSEFDLFEVPQDTPCNQLNATDPIILSVEELVSEVRCSNLQPTLTFNHPPSKISANFPDFPC